MTNTINHPQPIAAEEVSPWSGDIKMATSRGLNLLIQKGAMNVSCFRYQI